MSRPFLITGLPRSRTAWMSVAAMNEQSVCIHEPLKWLHRWEDVFSHVWGSACSAPYVGISDHALGFHLPEIMRQVSPRVLIIERPIEEVERSLSALGIPRSNYCYFLRFCLRRYRHANLLRTSFDSLERTNVVVDCLQWLMPDAPIDVRRVRQLQDMNIQAKLDDVRRIAAHRARDTTAILGADVIAELRLA